MMTALFLSLSLSIQNEKFPPGRGDSMNEEKKRESSGSLQPSIHPFLAHPGRPRVRLADARIFVDLA